MVLTSVLLASPLPYCHSHSFPVPPVFLDFTFESYQFHILISTLNVSSVTLLLKNVPIFTLLFFSPFLWFPDFILLFIPSFNSSVSNPLFYFPPWLPFMISLPIQFPVSTSQPHCPCPCRPLSFFFSLTQYKSLCWCT